MKLIRDTCEKRRGARNFVYNNMMSHKKISQFIS